MFFTRATFLYFLFIYSLAILLILPSLEKDYIASLKSLLFNIPTSNCSPANHKQTLERYLQSLTPPPNQKLKRAPAPYRISNSAQPIKMDFK